MCLAGFTTEEKNNKLSGGICRLPHCGDNFRVAVYATFPTEWVKCIGLSLTQQAQIILTVSSVICLMANLG
jgi:hypothetical protein